MPMQKGKESEKEARPCYRCSKACALDSGLLVNAGHGLNYFNVSKIVSIPGLRGLYIGHSIISRAVLVGLEKAVREMKALIRMSKENQ